MRGILHSYTKYKTAITLSKLSNNKWLNKQRINCTSQLALYGFHILRLLIIRCCMPNSYAILKIFRKQKGKWTLFLQQNVRSLRWNVFLCKNLKASFFSNISGLDNSFLPVLYLFFFPLQTSFPSQSPRVLVSIHPVLSPLLLPFSNPISASTQLRSIIYWSPLTHDKSKSSRWQCGFGWMVGNALIPIIFLDSKGLSSSNDWRFRGLSAFSF